MPELPEVETTLRGIKPYVLHQQITHIIVRHPTLRWPIPAHLDKKLQHQQILNLYRRAKYLVFSCANGSLILHLGMSGRLRVFTDKQPAQKHDHVDIHFANGACLRFTDPRRFGALLWTEEDPEKHTLLSNIGPEPLTKAFSGKYLWEKAQGKKVAVKTFIMNGQVVAGVGNIYATEALFNAKIKPNKKASSITLQQYEALATAIKTILKYAIHKGGTTLKDFYNSDGKPGYFSLELKVYGRDDEQCTVCGNKLKLIRLAQRSTVFCGVCQK